jgi:hypothetical protein
MCSGGGTNHPTFICMSCCLLCFHCTTLINACVINKGSVRYRHLVQVHVLSQAFIALLGGQLVLIPPRITSKQRQRWAYLRTSPIRLVLHVPLSFWFCVAAESTSINESTTMGGVYCTANAPRSWRWNTCTTPAFVAWQRTGLLAANACSGGCWTHKHLL